MTRDPTSFFEQRDTCVDVCVELLSVRERTKMMGLETTQCNVIQT